jgi:hypothetical protein
MEIISIIMISGLLGTIIGVCIYFIKILYSDDEEAVMSLLEPAKS